ncbi:MAG: helix-turn-helix transcriptional regulator [Opitutae bacterium]|nr:helix-turn-helix transcriptional regulator [Opitutae bacterium]
MRNYHGAEIAWANRRVQTPQVDFGRIKYTPGGYCGPRRQRDYQLVVIQSGGARATVDDETVALPVDHAVLFLPGHRELFTFSEAQETEHVWCSIRPRFVPAELRQRLAAAPRLVPCSELMHRLFAAAQGCRVVTPVAGRVIEHLGLALFAEFLLQVELGPRQTRQDERLRRAMACIEEQFGEEDCLARARRAAQCSESCLNQLFRRELGLGPARYLWLTRAERGAAMLRDTGLTVAEISIRCGCKNPFHFSRLIKRSQGLPPREVRRRAWQ